MHIPSTPRRAGRAGFTLIELLASIAIVGILAAILIATISRVRASSRGAVCLSNMRQIATAMQLYANDNQRYLPGPIYQLQGPYYNIDYRRLPMRLGPYVNAPKATSYGTAQSTMAYAEVFGCPSWKAASASDTIYSLVVNDRIARDGQPALNPWGFGDPNGTGNPADVTVPPLKLNQFDAYGITQSGSTWLIAEADMRFPVVGGAFWRVSSAPVHDNYRSAIFLDFHVGRLDLQNNPLN
ncbi:MAG: type II secretion system protein [Verrucomicrobiota bacterium]